VEGARETTVTTHGRHRATENRWAAAPGTTDRAHPRPAAVPPRAKPRPGRPQAGETRTNPKDPAKANLVTSPRDRPAVPIPRPPPDPAHRRGGRRPGPHGRLLAQVGAQGAARHPGHPWAPLSEPARRPANRSRAYIGRLRGHPAAHAASQPGRFGGASRCSGRTGGGGLPPTNVPRGTFTCGTEVGGDPHHRHATVRPAVAPLPSRRR